MKHGSLDMSKYGNTSSLGCITFFFPGVLGWLDVAGVSAVYFIDSMVGTTCFFPGVLALLELAGVMTVGFVDWSATFLTFQNQLV